MNPAGDWQSAFDAEGFVTFPASRRRLATFLAGALALVLIGIVLMLSDKTVTVVAGIVLALFAGGALVPPLIGRLVSQRPLVRVDHFGVAVDDDRVGWHEITSVRAWTEGRARVVAVGVTPLAALRVRGDPQRVKPAVGLGDSPAVRGPAMYLPSDNGYASDDLADWLNRLRARYGGPPTPTV